MFDYLSIFYEKVKQWQFKICLEGLKETKKNLSQDIRCAIKIYNRAPPKHKSVREKLLGNVR
jgi:hypothetical protein